MRSAHGLRRHRGLTVIIAALLVVVLLDVIPAVDEIGDSDPSTWPALASVGDFSTADVIVLATSMSYYVRQHEHHWERIALGRDQQ